MSYVIPDSAEIETATALMDLTTLESSETSGNRLPLLESDLALTRFIVQRVLTPVVVCLGVVGNIINIAVLTRRSMMNSSTNHYLSALAVFDVLYLVFAFVISVRHYPGVHDNEVTLYNRYRYLLLPLCDTCSNSAVWLTLSFTVERFIGVCHPMRGKVWCTPRRARFVVGVVCLAAAVITFPEFFENKMVEEVDTQTNVTRLKRLPTSFGSQSSYSVGYKYANQILFTFLPLVLLLVFNTLLIRQVMTATAMRSKLMALPRQSGSSLSTGPGSSRESRDQHRITIMLISVVVVFLLCQLPQATVWIYIIYHDVVCVEMTLRQKQVMLITGNVFNLLVMINCSANFILYSAFSSKFRATFASLFCRCRSTSAPTSTHRPSTTSTSTHRPPTTSQSRVSCCCPVRSSHKGRDVTPETCNYVTLGEEAGGRRKTATTNATSAYTDRRQSRDGVNLVTSDGHLLLTSSTRRRVDDDIIEQQQQQQHQRVTQF